MNSYFLNNIKMTYEKKLEFSIEITNKMSNNYFILKI